MSFVKDVVIRFKQSTSTDTVSNRIRVRPAGTPAARDNPFQDIPKPTPDADGYTRIPGANVTAMQGLNGRYDVHITAIDGRGNESDFLEIDNQLFDLVPPTAPTDGAIE